MKQSPLERIIRFIGIRPRSTYEVKRRLIRYGVTDLAPILTKLIEFGLLDDAAFAKWFTSSRLHSLRSPAMIRAELSSHHIEPELIKQMIQVDNNFLKDQIFKLLTKKYGPPHSLETETRHQALRYLSTRGFAWDMVSQVVKKYESA